MRPRLRSLDVFRGATVALMILVNNPGSWGHLFPPVAHAPWHGCTPTDLVFPFFLFAVGNALGLVMPALAALAAAAFWRKVATRTLLIFAIGVLLNVSPFAHWNGAGELAWNHPAQWRLMGVLQRIALAWGAAAVIVRHGGGLRAVPAWCAALLLGYWGACVAFGAPGDAYSLEGFFGTALDRALLGPSHLYGGEGVPFDPEGLASTVPAVAQVLIGLAVGEHVRRAPPDHALVSRLFMLALGLCAAAYAWSLAMPINKKLWTSSYVLLSSGIAIAVLASLLATIEIGGRDAAWMRAAEVFGRNALLIYMISQLVPGIVALLSWPDGAAPSRTDAFRWLFAHAFAPLASDLRVGSLLFAVTSVSAYWAMGRWLARRGLVLKI
ncbi:acyltransferase family protein [Caldimonas sp. KR1-144]|uniref:acyltransferase family protein n=1 Tax=Caldimonas sp. KR1-144 TaxID=3400911 RepID=UPI003C1152A5